MTILEFIEFAMPAGTRVFQQTSPPRWDEPPDWPPNLFAISTLLIERLDLLADWSLDDDDALRQVGDAALAGRAWAKVDWSEIADGVPPILDRTQRRHRERLGSWWQTLTQDFGGLEMTARSLRKLEQSEQRRLSLLVIQLAAVADEASPWVGFGLPNESAMPARRSGKKTGIRPRNWVQSVVAFQGLREGKVWDRKKSPPIGLTTLTLRLRPTIATVLPKARTPSVGCTLRALSHNLALLPPDTQVMSLWRYSPILDPGKSDQADFNILVVPFPYRVEPFDFQPETRGGSSRSAFFSLQQNWLPEGTPKQAAKRFCDWLEDLIRTAERDAPVHAVVFPELAIDQDLFVAAKQRLEALRRPSPGVTAGSLREPPLNVEVLVAGITRGRGSNRVNTAIFYKDDTEFSPSTPSQGKHHRWKLDRGQLARYGLSGALSGAEEYWEYLDLGPGPREVHFHGFRDDSVLCCLICEDLARLDPCQPVVRAIGPNLVIALLMDGPQIKERWPARYATVLAEDPGSSVLTVTSAGLMALTERLGGKTGERFVALWKSSSGDARPLELPPAHHALIACLRRHHRKETTIDGRDDEGSAVEWSLETSIPVRLDQPPDWLRT